MVLLLTLAVAASLQSTQVSQGLAEAASPEIAKAIAWLPANTEAIAVAAEPGKTKGFDVRATFGEVLPFVAQIGLPLDAKTGALWPISYDYIVQGIREIRSPHTPGGMNPPYDGCNIVGLQPAEEERLKASTIKQARHALVDGRDMYVVELKDGKDVLKIFAAFEDGVAFFATDKKYLSEVYARRKNLAADRAMPDTIAQWKYIEADAPFWAIHQWPAVGTKLNTGATVDASAPAGFAAWQSKDHKKVNVLEIDNTENGLARVKEMWDGYLQAEPGSKDVDYKQIDARTTLVTIDSSVNAEQPMFLLMGLLGHPIFL